MLTIDPIHIQSVDARRDAAIPGNEETTIRFAVEHWIRTAQQAITKHNRFAVALSGGSTPLAIYQMLSQPSFAQQIDWSKVYLFWSDERSVSPDHPDSNYHMAMTHGFNHLPIPSAQIFRMKAETDIHKAAADYEEILRTTLGSKLFDLVMLGVGEDGHTASLFPNTEALHKTHSLVAANYVSEKNTWRMTLTIHCINQSERTVFYVLGASKKTIVNSILRSPGISPRPASSIGTGKRKALWILDESAAQLIIH